MQLKEEWLPCVGYEGLYEVSNIGRVRSLRTKTRIVDKEHGIMRLKKDNKGYYRVNLHRNGRMKAELVSRLVAVAFIPNLCDMPLVGHWDDNKENNTIDNLYWTDNDENNKHNGKHDRLIALHNQKIDIIAEKLSVPVVAMDEKTGKTFYFPSMHSAESVGFNSCKISDCCNGKRKHHGGLVWRKF